MYKCDLCGSVVEYLPCKMKRPPYWSARLSHIAEETNECECGGIYCDAARCEICGEPEIIDDLHDGVCEKCISKLSTLNNVYECYKDSDKWMPINIHPLFTTIFTSEEINGIIFEWLEKQLKFERGIGSANLKMLIKDFVMENPDEFGEYLNGAEGGRHGY